MKAALPVLASALALAACVPSVETPAPAPAPAPAPSAAVPSPQSPHILDTVVPANWMDAPSTPGNWLYRAQAGGGEASFAGRDNRTLARLRCERANGGVVLALPDTGLPRAIIGIHTETLTVSLPSVTREGERIVLLPAGNPLLDAMALSKGRFAVGMEGMAPLYLPSWAEVSRVIEECR